MPDNQVFRRLGNFAVVIVVIHGAGLIAASPKEYVTITAVTDGDTHTDDRGLATSNINVVAIKYGSLVSAGEYQFTSYYGADGKLILARRNRAVNPQRWEILRTKFTAYNVEDRHNTSCIAIDGGGRLHAAWGMHGGGPLLYSRSENSVLNEKELHIPGEQNGNAGALQKQVPLQNDTRAITYPQFWNVPNSCDLLLTYRVGSAGNGRWQLARWDNASSKWTSIHTSLKAGDSSRQPWIESDYSGDALPNVCAYHNGLVFDASRRIHMTWTWRTGSDSPSGLGDFQSNHNIMYAYSNDLGRTWHRDNGQLYERNGRHDIDENNAAPVVMVPEGSSMMNQSSATVGPDGHYYMANYWAPQAVAGNHLREYMLVEFDGRKWRVHQVTNRRSENGDARIPESRLHSFRMSRPIVLTDRDNRVLLVFSDHQRGGVVSVAYSDDAERSKWKFFDLTDENAGLWEPTYDRERWNRDGVLSMLYQPCGLKEKASTMSVIEWRTRVYFAER
jgi:hypothetical protein